jgi:hypothetical protein
MLVDGQPLEVAVKVCVCEGGGGGGGICALWCRQLPSALPVACSCGKCCAAAAATTAGPALRAGAAPRRVAPHLGRLPASAPAGGAHGPRAQPEGACAAALPCGAWPPRACRLSFGKVPAICCDARMPLACPPCCCGLIHRHLPCPATPPPPAVAQPVGLCQPVQPHDDGPGGPARGGRPPAPLLPQLPRRHLQRARAASPRG